MLSTAAPIGGTEVLLSSDNMLLPVPAPSVTVPAGAYSATFMLTAGSTSRPQSATLMAIALNSVVLSWNPSMSSNLMSYKIYRGVTLGGPYALLKTVGLVTNYIDYDVQPSQTYYYLVRAVDDHGTESAYSNAASVVLPSQRPQTATVTFRPDVPFDFNGGGVPDLVWQNTTTSQVGVWYMGGTGGAVRQSSAWISESGVPGWRVMAVADFNGGGVPDLVWQNTTTSQVAVWYMGGTGGVVRQSSAWISESGVPGWTVVAAADFNGDGIPDLVWENSAGQVSVWYMGGTGGAVRQSSAWISESGVPGWTVVD